MSLTKNFPVTVFTVIPPFAIKKQIGVEYPDNSYYVETGVCFSSFSFDTGSFVPIKGLGSGTHYVLEEDKKLFIDISILPNLQVSGAEIRCENVGPNGLFWEEYPNMIAIKPKDELDENGRVKKILDNKKQTNCFVLIGYRDDDVTKNGGPNPLPSGAVKKPIQILDSNFILLASVVSGVPVIFPSPYFNGRKHLDAVAGII
jgi:hypothetical protein